MSTPKNPTEPAKRAITQTARAISGEKDVELQFSTDAPMEVGKLKRIPMISRHVSAEEVRRARGAADAFAFYQYYHSEKLAARFQFDDPRAGQIFENLERMRTEIQGGRSLPGALTNIDFEREARYTAEGEASKENTGLDAAMALWLRKNASNKPLPPEAEARLELWEPQIENTAVDELEALLSKIDDQEAFAKASMNVLEALGFEMPESDPTEDNSPEDNEDEETEAEEEPDSTGEDDAQEEEEPETSTSSEDEQQEDADAQISQDDNQQDEGDPQDSEADEPQDYAPPVSEADPNYQVFTREFDQMIAAEDLAEPEELERLREFLDRQIEPIKAGIARLAHRLQRRLMAKQNRSWLFDQEEGILDVARLARVVANPTTPLSFKVEKDIIFRDTVVSLLIDNSGSMRGRPISIAAICADVLAQTLERCQVKSEVLGFTTIAWKGGKSREKWLEAGRSANPGRLNDLRHIVYKSADAPWRRARNNLGLMMKEGLLKENIDGEALEWAHSRLTARPEQRRILMVISDGAPVDDSTLSVNSSNYLESHLRKVIEMIEKQKQVELVAIGIGHDVTRYYKRAVTITDPEQLAGAVTEQLAALFDENPKSQAA